MNPSNPLADREKAFENKYIHDKECVPARNLFLTTRSLTNWYNRKQMAKDRANKKTQTESLSSTKDSSSEQKEGSDYKEEISKLSAMPS